MKIGISGANGQLGKLVLAEIAAQAPDATRVGISRTPDQLVDGVTRRLGDYDRPETLATAYADLDRLLIIPSADLRIGVRAKQFIAAIDAAVAAGVKHIVLLSALGARAQAEPSIGAPYWTGEQHLINTAATWTIVRMSYYAEAFAQEAQMSASLGAITGLNENRVSFVSRGDVAAALAGVLLGSDHAGAVYSATGPKAVTGAERAAAAQTFTGKPFRFVAVTDAQLRGGLAQAALPQDVIDAVASIQASFVAGAFDVVTGDVERLAGRAPKSLEHVLSELSTSEI